MSGDNTTTLANLIQNVWVPDIASTKFYNNFMLGHFGTEPAPGGSSIDWAVEVAGTNNAETYDDGDPMASPNARSILKATVAKQPFQVTAKISNVARDYLLNGGSSIPISDPALESVNNAISDLSDKVNTTLLATLEAAIDATGSYAGISESTYTSWASYEETNSTALTLAHMEDMYEALLAADRACDYGMLEILLPFNQGTNFSRLRFGASNIPFNTDRSQNFDGGRYTTNNGQFPAWNGIPVIGVPDMTTTNVLMLQRDLVHVYETRAITVEPKSALEDAQLFEITCNYQVIYKNKQKAGKLSAKTA